MIHQVYLLKQIHFEMLRSAAQHNFSRVKKKAQEKLEKQQANKKWTEANFISAKLHQNNVLIAQ